MTPAERRAAPLLLEKRILVVDDEASIRSSIGRYLQASGYEVVAAESVPAALDRLRESRFATLLCDIRFPGTSGMDLIPDALRLDPDLAILMLSGINDAAAASEAMALGAIDYLIKPVELDRLKDAIGRGLRRRRDRVERRDLTDPLRDQLMARTEELARENLALTRMAVTALEAVVSTIEEKTPGRAGNSERVARIAAQIATVLRCDAGEVSGVRLAARLHDIGNVAIPDAILLKPAALTHQEYDLVREHVTRGLQMLAPLYHLAPTLALVREHHERWDGSGYPAGLRGEAGSLGGRILAVADAYVAVTAGRPYFPARPPRDAVAYLAPHAGRQFDPRVFGALQQIVNDRGS
jgi:response regulator RpfG family c-di-GMP phosphodiesterase